MPAKLKKLTENLKAYQQGVDAVILDIVRDKKGLVLSMNRSQLFAGQDANGIELSPPYARSTVRIKRRKGDPYDRVTLKDEGDFYASFDLEFGQSEFAVNSDDQKAVYLERRYGADVYGLTPENTNILREEIKLGMVEKLKEATL